MLSIFKQNYPIRKIFFILGEASFVMLSLLLSELLLSDDFFSRDIQGITLKGLLVTAMLMICLYYNDLYDTNSLSSMKDVFFRLMQSLGVVAIILSIIEVFFPEAVIENNVFFLSVVWAMLFMISWRLAYSYILHYGLFNSRLILLGSSRLAQEIANEIATQKDCGYTLSMVIPEGDETSLDIPDGIPVKPLIGRSYKDLCKVAEDMEIKNIVVALKEKRGSLPIKELLKCKMKGIHIHDGVSFYEMLTGKLIVEQINPGWLIFSDGFRKSPARRILKRTLDIILCVISIPLVIPAGIVAILIKIDSKGPVFFFQERVGENEKIYKICKFRSMVEDAEKLSGPVWAEDEDPRITRVGRFIRKWRIDEIPQIWNVIKGEMSFVGPRPERKYFVEQLKSLVPYYEERFHVKPGITGWAQVNYGYGSSVKDAIEKLNYDLFYIKNMTTLMDIMILFRTIKIVIFGMGR